MRIYESRIWDRLSSYSCSCHSGHPSSIHLSSRSKRIKQVNFKLMASLKGLSWADAAAYKLLTPLRRGAAYQCIESIVNL
jgi:hypothetical protein